MGRFLVEHNWKRCLLSLMAILIGIRFLPDLDVPVIGGEMTPVKALGLGLGLDKFVQYLKDRTNLLGQKKTA
ncbi:MAG: hypothetical protein EOP50_01640 [Sphingobacteriales bacterium]|nr:MAG: hypothetical protein EOP50_01640 [Sphingobacteriales bacterium]